jgi:hypothetical protein
VIFHSYVKLPEGKHCFVGVSESGVNPLNRQLFKRGHVDKAVDGMGLLSDPGSLGSMKAIIYCQPQPRDHFSMNMFQKILAIIVCLTTNSDDFHDFSEMFH